MSWMLFVYMGAFVAAFTVVLIAGAAYWRLQDTTQKSDSARAEYELRVAKLPEATRWADLTSKVADLEARHQEMRDHVANAEFTLEQTRLAQAQLKSAEEKLHELNPKLEQLERAKAEFQFQVDELHKSEKRAAEMRLEADSQEIRRDRIKEEVTSLEQKQQQALADLDGVRKRVDEAKVQEASLAAKDAGFQQQLVQLEQQINTKANALVKVEQDLEKRHNEYRDLKIECDRAQAMLHAARTEAEALKNVIATLRADYEILLKNLTSGEHAQDNAQAEIWLPVLSSSGRVKQNHDEQQAIEEVETYLKSQNLHFSDRTIRAFHTCLKVADESPLSVLAGISGTGKSELPRRYAEALGIHFLLMPIQPRWDSSQDIFGFFNYLEGRYRPTELTRALLQMDRYYERPNRGWRPAPTFKSLNDQMLLVLLDEMNIARVEYYFSDLLSKLETRRGVDSNDDQLREKAELVLEVGRRPQASSGGATAAANAGAGGSLRLFIDTNVLFVGTMNEDESTQTLSDKVVDRANVLRFGKPNSLSCDAHEGNGQQTHNQSVQPLAFSAWQHWRQSFSDLSDSDRELVDKTSRQLNDAMQAIGRPFAFRMDRAIRAYVANYVTHTPGEVKTALADQIEFRILPRLRGLDPDDPASAKAMTQVGEVLENLGDTKLQKALEISRKRFQHQFVWQGLDRTEVES